MIDSKNKTVRQLKIDRDTMAEVTVLGMLGNPVGTTQMQISIAHGFGDGREESCGYARDAVSRLLQGESIDFLPCSIRWITIITWAASTTNSTQSMDITKSIVSGATKQRKNERIYGLSCALRLGKDVSFSRLLHEETDGEGTFFCKEVWSFCLFVQKNLRIKGQSVKLKKRTCMVNLRGCTNEDTGRR